MAKAKRKHKPKLVKNKEAVLLRPENDPDTILEQCKGVFESVFVIGYRKDGYLDEHFTQNLTEPDILMMIEQYKHWLLTGEPDE
jgi:hypothetical protein